MLVATAVYSYLGRNHLIPEWTVDEILYGEMARGVAAGHGATWRGSPLGVSAIYSYVISPAWMLFQPTTAYAVARAIGTLLACSTAIPVWLLARELTRGWRVWIAPVGTLLGSWMIITTRLLTENLAWPLATWSLAALTICLVRERSRGWLAAAAAFALAATAVRLQLVVLLPVIPLAVGLDLLRRGELTKLVRGGTRAKTGVVSIAAAPLLALAAHGLLQADALGRYRGITANSPSLATVIYWAYQNFLELTLMTGVIPVAVLIALAARRANWSHEKTGALLCVAVPALILTVLQVGWFSAAHTTLLLDRYLIYLVPFALMAVALASSRIGVLPAVGAALMIGLPVLTIDVPDGVSQYSDGFMSLTHLTVGAGAVHGGDALTAFAVIVTAAALVGTLLAGVATKLGAEPRRGLRRLAAPAACTLIALALVASSAWNWHSIGGRNSALAASDYPRERAWVDRAGSGPVSLISLTSGVRDQAYVNELFNDRVQNAFALSPLPTQQGGNGYACRLAIAPDGRLAGRGCASPSHDLLLLGVDAQLTFANSTRVVDQRAHDAQLVSVAGAPRVYALARFGCPQQLICAFVGTISLWTDGPVTLRFDLRTGSKPLSLEARGRRIAAPAHAHVVREVSFASAPRVLELKPASGATNQSVEAVRSVTALQNGKSIEIYHAG